MSQPPPPPPPGPYAHPPLLPLEQWLDPEASRWVDPNQSTALRDMALNLGIRRGLGAMLFLLSDVLVGFCVLTYLAFPESRTLWITAGVLGVAFSFATFLVRGPARTKLPSVSPANTFHSPTSARAGFTLLAVLGIPICVIIYFPLAPLLATGALGVATFLGYYLLILLTMASVFLVPGYFIGNSRRDFRRFIEVHPEHRRTLEELSLSWRDPVANMAFGPL